MLVQTRRFRMWQVALLVTLCVCLAALPASVLLWTGRMAATERAPVHSLTLGAVWCPYSAIVGWNGGHGWTAVTNVVNCSPGGPPAAWMLLRWPNGRRTSLCADFAKQHC